MKRFKGRKRPNRKRFKILFFLTCIAFSFAFCLSYFSHLLRKEEVLEFLIESTLLEEKNTIKQKSTSIFDFLLDYTIGKKKQEDNHFTLEDVMGSYVEDPTPEENQSKSPVVYIYSTHQGEGYGGGVLHEHDITPTVMMASFKLREELNKRGIPTIVETTSISDIINANGWNYYDTYRVSRMLMENAKQENPTLEYFIDFHRDAIPYESSILRTSEKTYAKIMFVIGSDHEAANQNIEWATRISDTLNSKVNGISRGLYYIGNREVNGVYNQDFSPKTLLFEVGANYNRISEVNNTIEVLADTLKELIG